MIFHRTFTLWIEYVTVVRWKETKTAKIMLFTEKQKNS